MMADTLILPLVEFVVRWRICNLAIPLSPAKKLKNETLRLKTGKQ
jgi:hypothetical protein